VKVPKVGSLVRVVWDDAASNDSWSPSPNRPTLSECVSVGYLVSASKRRLNLAATIADRAAPDGERRYAERIAIPKGCIRKIGRLA
jgi:hypothetical protein